MSRDVEVPMGMPDHLPECPFAAGFLHHSCICDRLRACEQRSYTLGIEVGKHDGWVAGHAAGVLAARDAVAALRDRPNGLAMKDDALAAIDGLMEEKS